MNGLGPPRKAMTLRMVIGLLAVTAGFLLSPVASAQPDADANAAITAAWEASGGDEGPLGPRQGDVYAVGEGFAQNFASGKIFFTPTTGAHIMQGAILEKYEALGGPANSDLGFPTIDEGPGRAPESRNTTFSAPDNPVIFWTPSTGARVVRGPINAAWDKLGGSTGQLGVPAEDEAYRGDLVSQKFTGGEVSFNMQDRTFNTVPPELEAQLADLEIPDDPTAAINAARRAAGGALGPLGAAEGPPYPIGEDGLAQNFAGGKIFFTPETGASVVTGNVLAKYESVGGPEGDLGFPTSSEADGGLGTQSRIVRFAAEDEPVIFWTPDHGAVIVRGAMAAAWDRLGGAKGELGAPVADQTENGDVITQRFTGGAVSWDREKRTFTTEPANLANALSGLDVPGQQAPDGPDAPEASDSNGNKWFQWSWWWLLAIIPVLVLIGLVAFATMRNRNNDPFASDERGFDDDHEPAYATAGQAPTDDDYSAAMFADRYSREGLGAFTPPQTGTAPREDDDDLWGAPDPVDDDDEVAEADEDVTDDDDPDSVDTAPTPRLTVVARDPITDTGRHARIEDDPAEPVRMAFLLADDPDEAPEGYPVKANTKSGQYWTPGSASYDDAVAEIWFATEELARANGFIPGGGPR